MKKFGICVVVLVVAATMTFALRGGTALGAEMEPRHERTPTPTRLLMQLISAHTSKILDAILVGDYEGVVKEVNAVINSSKALTDNFFPGRGQIGSWFKETGKDPNDPKAVEEVKKEFVKYLDSVVDSAKKIAETAKTKDIMATYERFDNMLTESCFNCHKTFRPKWPEWGDWMSIAGG